MKPACQNVHKLSLDNEASDPGACRDSVNIIDAKRKVSRADRVYDNPAGMSTHDIQSSRSLQSNHLLVI